MIAERAASDPARALPVLVRAACESGNPDVLAALGKLDVADLPEPVREDLRLPARRPRGTTVAIALGAAAKWPERGQGRARGYSLGFRTRRWQPCARSRRATIRASHAILAPYVAK